MYFGRGRCRCPAGVRHVALRLLSGRNRLEIANPPPKNKAENASMCLCAYLGGELALPQPRALPGGRSCGCRRGAGAVGPCAGASAVPPPPRLSPAARRVPRGMGSPGRSGRRPGSPPRRRRYPRHRSGVSRPGRTAAVLSPSRPASRGVETRGSSDRDIWVKSSAFSVGRDIIVIR